MAANAVDVWRTLIAYERPVHRKGRKMVVVHKPSRHTHVVVVNCGAEWAPPINVPDVDVFHLRFETLQEMDTQFQQRLVEETPLALLKSTTKLK